MCGVEKTPKFGGPTRHFGDFLALRIASIVHWPQRQQQKQRRQQLNQRASRECTVHAARVGSELFALAAIVFDAASKEPHRHRCIVM